MDRWRVIVVALLLSGVMASAASGQEATPVAMPNPDLGARDFGPVAANSPYRLALLVPYPDSGFWQTLQRAAAERAAADGVTLDVFALDLPSVPQQVTQIENAVAQRYDAILLGPIDPIGVVPGIVSANAAGIPVFAIDSEPAGGEVVGLVHTDDLAAGRIAGQTLAVAMGGRGRVLDLQGDMGHPVAQDRDTGLLSALGGFPAIDVVAESAHWNRQEAAFTTQSYLRKPVTGTPAATPEVDEVEPVDAVFAANDQMTLGAVDAIRQNGGTGTLVVGFGETAEVLEAVRTGGITAAIAELPQRMGAIAVDVTVRHLNGETTPPVIDSGVAVVTQENVAQFAPASATPATR